jgi:hypothetical protein
LSYKDDLPTSSTFKGVSENEIAAAKLLQNYVESYEKKINSLLDSYNSQNTEIIQTANNSLKKMSRSLDVIQYKSINPLVVNEVMKSIVTDLKIINNRMKIYLEQERQLHVEKLQFIQDNYTKVGNKISFILDELVSSLSSSLIKKESLSDKEKEIIRSLVVIRSQNNKIKDFKNKSFNSEVEMKQYFQDIIPTLRTEIISMKR